MRERAVGHATGRPVREGGTGRLCAVASRWVSFVAVGLVATLGTAHAIGLGTAVLDSGLGEPLHFSIPVALAPDEEVGCIQVRPRGDDVPGVFNARASVVRVGGETRIEVRSVRAVQEPTVALVVSVGCASAVSREFVFFLDPLPEPVPATTVPRSVVEPTVPRTTPTARPPRTAPAARRPAQAAASGKAPTSAPRPPPAQRARPPRSSPVTPPPGDTAAPATKAPLRPAPAATPPAPPVGGSDRLSVVPTQPPAATVAPTAPSSAAAPVTTPAKPAPAAPSGDRLSVVPTQPPPAPATSAPSGPVASGPIGATSGSGTGTGQTGPAPSVPAAGPASSTGTVATAPESTTPPPAVDQAAVEREQVLKQQRDSLQARLKTLDEQIAALRAQTEALTIRNQALEQRSPSSVLMWVLLAIAIAALLVAASLAWRYARLRRTLEEGGPWYANTTHTTVGAEGTPTSMDPPATAGVAPATVAPMTVLRVPLRTDVRASNVATVPVEPEAPPPERPRTSVRPKNYPPAIETDFTVSDIEAAMATVRTVPTPHRDTIAPPPLTDTDLRALGGPTMPSPFIEPPAAPVPVAQPPVAKVPPSPPPAKRPASPAEAPIAASGAGDPGASTVDFDVPPIEAPVAAVSATPATPATPAPPRSLKPSSEDPTATFDFALDIPSEFDPLATDSHKQTQIMGATASDLDFELPPVPSSLDLPAQTDFGLKTDHDARVRHGATALDQLFATDTTGKPFSTDLNLLFATDTGGKLGPDTILDLDDRSGVRLSSTEVQALGGGEPVTVQQRMTRFADVMNQVDDSAGTDALRSIALLRQHVLRDEDIPTILWLRLFELYKAVDKRPVYEALAEHFSRRYHRTMVGWDQTLADRVPQTPLAALRDLDAEIESIWGTNEGLHRLHALLCGRDQPDTVVFNAVLQRDLLDAAKVFLLDRDSSISKT